MAATPSIRIVVSSQWKGNTKEWGNRFHFNGGTPADPAHWTTLAGNVWTAYKAALSDHVSGVRAVGYAAGSDVPVWTGTISGSGALTQSGSVQRSPAEVSALVRWSTTARTSKNHPVYLFSYVRAALRDVSVGEDALATSQKTALGTFANSWITGFSDGSITAVRAGPNGATGVGQLVETYTTHRDFPR